MQEIGKLLSQRDSAEVLTVLKKMVKLEHGETTDWHEAMLEQLIEKVRSGMYDVPLSKIPVDFHRFYFITWEWSTEPITTKSIMSNKYGVVSEWCYNAPVSNYPTLSMDKRVYQLLMYCFDGSFPNRVNFKYFISWISTIYYELDSLMADNKMFRFYRWFKKWMDDKQIELSNHLPRYQHFDEVDDKDVMKLYMTGDYTLDCYDEDSEQDGLKMMIHNQRIFFVMVPKEIIKMHNYKILQTHLIY